MIRTIYSRMVPVAAMVLLATGCKREEIRVYVAPKEPPAENVGDHGNVGAQIAWKLPTGWHETAPSKVSFASFAIAAKEGEATVNISQLPDLRGREMLVVNMCGSSRAGAVERGEAASTHSVVAAGARHRVSSRRMRDGTRADRTHAASPEAAVFQLAGRSRGASRTNEFSIR